MKLSPVSIIDRIKKKLTMTDADVDFKTVALVEAIADELNEKLESGAGRQEVVEYWNSKPELPKVKAVTNGRKRKLEQRCSEPFFRDNYQEGIDRIAASDFCLGRNATGWQATLDFLLQPDALAKVLEGKYDNRPAIARARSVSNLGTICP